MSAIISECGKYRYRLERTNQSLIDTPSGMVNFIMLNPSTADATKDDPTIKRCIGFMQRLMFARMVVTNLFAYRATDPKELQSAVDPIGPENDDHIIAVASESDLIIYAWGAGGKLMGRDNSVRDLLSGFRGAPPRALKVTKNGHPQHPLYIAADTKPIPFL